MRLSIEVVLFIYHFIVICVSFYSYQSYFIFDDHPLFQIPVGGYRDLDSGDLGNLEISNPGIPNIEISNIGISKYGIPNLEISISGFHISI